jgi:hypothetical protein
MPSACPTSRPTSWSSDIAAKIEQHDLAPGQIRVTVIREAGPLGYAK